MSITERRRIFNKLVAFFRQVDIRYKCMLSYINYYKVEPGTEKHNKKGGLKA